MECLDRYQQWRENLPDSLTDNALAERLDAMLEWRDLVDQLSLCRSAARIWTGLKIEPRCSTQNVSLQVEPNHRLILESRHAWSISTFQRLL